MKPIIYELIRCEIGADKIFFNGIKIDTKQDIKRITHSADYNAIGYVTGDKTVDFSLTDPKDAKALVRLYDLWVESHTPFTLQLFGKNVHTHGWDMVAALTGCVLNKIDHNLKAKEEWKPSVSGMAMDYKRLNYQFNPQTGGVFDLVESDLNSVASRATQASNAVNAISQVSGLLP